MMKSWRDYAAAAAALAILVIGPAYAFVVTKAPTIDRLNKTPVHLLPACDYYPKGINGEPCVNPD